MEEGKGVNLLDLGKGVAKGAELEKVWVVGRLSLRGCLCAKIVLGVELETGR